MELNREERRVLDEKGTEAPFTGEFLEYKIDGEYFCRKCGELLYKSQDKFDSGCGWPSFDEAVGNNVKEQPDPDGRRVEIVCNSCGGHLGHLFRGENLTQKNTRYCVNSVSLTFKPSDRVLKKAYFAGGCFWGVEYYMKKLNGVLSVLSGYTGGDVDDPSYEMVKRGSTGHVEVVEVTYDPKKTGFRDLLKYFMEIHDPTQEDGQGPDIGEQYNSAIFYQDDDEKVISGEVIEELKKLGYQVVTRLEKFKRFFRAEDYHQNYYKRAGKEPYCHSYKKKFK